MTEATVEIAQFNQLEVHIVRSARRRTLTIEIDHRGVVARAPANMRELTIRNFIAEKHSWIQRHLESFAPPPPRLWIEHGIQIRLLGQAHQLQFEHQSRSSPRIKHGKLVLPLCRSHLPIEQTARSKLIRWYKKQAVLELRNRACRFTPLIFSQQGKPPPPIKVREYKRRWGSCDNNGKLTFNWRIIMAPPWVIDYVVVHELAHLIEFNHSSRFWQIVERQLPNWNLARQWLAQHGTELYRI